MALQNTLRAMADPTRRAILELLREQSLSAGSIASHFDMTQAAVSKHLAILRQADLVRDSRQGRCIVYELNASVLEELLLWVEELKVTGHSAPAAGKDPAGEARAKAPLQAKGGRHEKV